KVGNVEAVANILVAVGRPPWQLHFLLPGDVPDALEFLSLDQRVQLRKLVEAGRRNADCLDHEGPQISCFDGDVGRVGGRHNGAGADKTSFRTLLGQAVGGRGELSQYRRFPVADTRIYLYAETRWPLLIQEDAKQV